MRLVLLDTFCLLVSMRLYEVLTCGRPIAFSLGVEAGLDLTLSWGWTTLSHAFRSK